MLEFKKLLKDVYKIKEYLERSPISFCDISLGVKYAWREEFKVEYAIYNDTLILRESGHDHIDAFYYPMGADELGALEQIEKYCLKNFKPLTFCYIDERYLEKLSARYTSVKVRSERDWCDYIYFADAFKTYAGKKLSGQRNHVNKFKNLYPDYKFKTIEKTDLAGVKKFLKEYEQDREQGDWAEKVEQLTAIELIENAQELNQKCALIEVNGKVVAISVGEVMGDTLIVHIEKALRDYSGVYPVMAQEFAKAFANEGVQFINREEDCGDLGLRTSKLQYKPYLIKEKNILMLALITNEYEK